MTISTITPLPTAPSRDDAPATFISRANAFLAAMVTMGTELNTSIGQMNTDIAGVNSDADRAESAADSAVASANFKGAWSSLTGALNIPASVTHNGYLWILLNNLADVTASEPGVSADWQDLPTIPAQTGNAGKYLTTDGSSTSWAAVSSGSTIMTATGAISAGDPVALRTDGTVEKITGSKTQLGIESNRAFTSSTDFMSYNDAAQDPNTNIVLRVYEEGSVTFAKAYRVASNGTVTEGTALSLGINILQEGPKVFWDATNSNFLVHYRRTGVIAIRSMSVDSGTLAVTAGTEQDKSTGLNANAASRVTMAYDSDADQYFILFIDATSGYAQCAYGTYDGSDITFGTTAALNAVASNMLDATYAAEETRIICQIGTSSSSSLVAVLNSGGTPVGGAAVALQSTYQNFYPKVVWNGSKIIAAEQVNSRLFMYLATLSGSVITLTGTQLFINTTVYAHSFVLSPTNDVYYFYQQVPFEYYEIDTSGSTPTYKNKVVLDPDATAVNYQHGWGFIWLSDIGGIDMVYGGGAMASGTTNRQNLFYVDAESTNAQNFVGIANENIADAATGSIATAGGVNTSVSGLTPSKDYFVQADGSISTSQSQYGLAGKSITATSLLINPSKNINAEQFVAASNISQGAPVRLRSDGDAEEISGAHNFYGVYETGQLFTSDSDFCSILNIPNTNLYVTQYRNRLRVVRVNSDGSVTLGTEKSTVEMFGGQDTRARLAWAAHADCLVVGCRLSSSYSTYGGIITYPIDQANLTVGNGISIGYFTTTGTNAYCTGLIPVDNDYFAVQYNGGASNFAGFRIFTMNSSGGSITLGSEYNPTSVTQSEGAIAYSAKHNVIFSTIKGPTSGRFGIVRWRRTGTNTATSLGYTAAFFYNADNAPPVAYVDDENDVVMFLTIQSNSGFYYKFYDVSSSGITVPSNDNADGPLSFPSSYTSDNVSPITYGRNTITGNMEAHVQQQSNYTVYLYELAYDGANQTLSLESENIAWYQWPTLYERQRMREFCNNGQVLPYNEEFKRFFMITNQDQNRGLDTYFFGWTADVDVTNTSNFVGYAAEDIAAASSGAVYVNGSYINASGRLTAGADVYFDSFGKQTTTVNGQKIGKTSTANKLILG